MMELNLTYDTDKTKNRVSMHVKMFVITEIAYDTQHKKLDTAEFYIVGDYGITLECSSTMRCNQSSWIQI